MPSEIPNTSKSFDIGNHSVVVTEYDMLVGDDKVDIDVAPNKVSFWCCLFITQPFKIKLDFL